MPTPEPIAAHFTVFVPCSYRSAESVATMEVRVPVQTARAPRIYLLGGFRVEVDGEPVSHVAWRLRKAESLVKMLALAPGRQLHREVLLEELWPDLPPEAAGRNLRKAIHYARRVLAPRAPTSSGLLAWQSDLLTLSPDAPLWTDAEAFEAAAASARDTGAAAEYERALALYGGDLLPADLYADWSADRRQRLRGLYVALLGELAELCQAQRDWDGARAALERALAAEPAHESAHVALMRLHARRGDRHGALRQFQQLREALRRDVDAEPSAASERLHDDIRAGRFPTALPVPAARQPSGDVETRRPRDPAEVLAPRARHNLPNALTSFVGREAEVHTVRRLLGAARLVTLQGAGGSGKTRLALRVAADLLEREHFPDGIWLVELADISDPSLLEQAIAEPLGVREVPGQPLADTLASYLRARQLLLVLDNCEQLVAPCAVLAERLLRASPRLHVLATSREVLGAAGETTWPVPPLTLPPNQRLSVEELTSYEAIRLFVERARAAEAGFALSAETSPAVGEVCRRLDGLPLAIELAATRVRALAVQDLARRLDDRFRLLTSGSRTAPSRQQTLRAAMDWSYELLTERERALLQRLAVFAGGFTVQSAEAVCAGGALAADDVLDLLSALVDKSLVQVERREEPTRYRLLETIRQYANDRLLATGDRETWCARRRDWHVAFMEHAASQLFDEHQDAWLERLDAEYANLRETLEWCETVPDGASFQFRLLTGLMPYWGLRGQFGEWRGWAERVLARADAVEAALRGHVLGGTGYVMWLSGDLGRATDLFEQGLRWSREAAAPWGTALALAGLGYVASDRGDHERAVALHGEALGIWRELGDRWGTAVSVGGLGTVALARGEYARAAALQEEALALSREIRDKRGIGYALGQLGRIAMNLGEYEQAEACYSEALALARAMGESLVSAMALDNLGGIARARGDLPAARRLLAESLADLRQLEAWPHVAAALRHLGEVAQDQGDVDEATELYRQSLAHYRRAGDRVEIARGLERLAGAAVAGARPAEATRLLATASALRERLGIPLAPAERMAHDQAVADARAALGEARFAATWSSGHASALEVALAAALAPWD